MTNIRTLFIYLFVFLSITHIFAAEILNPLQTQVTEEKIYIPHEQILVTQEGIFLMTGDTPLPLSKLHCDEAGIYVTWTKEHCEQGHSIKCQRCKGCTWRNCIHACWCR